MNVKITKLTDEELMRQACDATFNGSSKQGLLSIYKSEHSPSRTQIFWIQIEGIGLATSTHFIRHHVGGAQPFALTCRPDRDGGNTDLPSMCSKLNELSQSLSEAEDEATKKYFVSEIESITDYIATRTDRNTPVKLSLLWNAQNLIDIAKLRLCSMSAKETIGAFKVIKEKISEIDPDLAKMMVVKCIYRGGICGEPRCCGFNNTDKFKNQLSEYLSYFSDKQKGIHSNK